MSAKETVAEWLGVYGGSSGTAGGGALCAVCMAGMYSVVAAAGGTAGAAGLAGLFAWVPVMILGPVSGVVLAAGLGGLWFSRRRTHGRWLPLALAVPAGAFLEVVMFGPQGLLFQSTLVLVLYGLSLVALVAAGLWDVKLVRAHHRGPEAGEAGSA